MLRNFIHGQVYIFVDVSNVFYSQQTLGWHIAYAKLMEYLKRECGERVKCFVYAAYEENKLAERKFLDMLDINGYILRTKALKEIHTGEGRQKHKGSLDIELAFEMVELVDAYDTAVLISGDSDFAPALERIKKKGKRVIVMSTRGRVGKELLDLAKFIDLRKLRAEISQ